MSQKSLLVNRLVIVRCVHRAFQHYQVVVSVKSVFLERLPRILAKPHVLCVLQESGLEWVKKIVTIVHQVNSADITILGQLHAENVLLENFRKFLVQQFVQIVAETRFQMKHVFKHVT